MDKKIITILILVLLITGVYVSATAQVDYNHFEKAIYPLQKAESDLAIANSSDNLSYIALEMNMSYMYMEKYNGNPDWWYPTHVTSWAYIKNDVLSVENQAELFDKTVNVSGLNYVQDVNHVHSSIQKIESLVSNQIFWLKAQPLYLYIDLGYMLLIVSLIALGLYYFDEEDDYFPGIVYVFSAIAVVLTLAVIGSL